MLHSLTNLLTSIINEKCKELKIDEIDKSKPFWKIIFFEGNAIGQIGEKFIRDLIIKNNIRIGNPENTHDEYDIKINDIKIEVKTARVGKKSSTFQFNGINPKYNYSYIICIGITQDEIYYKIIEKNSVEYLHKERKYYVYLNNDKTNKKQLVKMNPDNMVNYKLTLSIKDLNKITNFEKELMVILK
jgi:hypothetical protein